MPLAIVASAITIINLPFGYWRAQTKRFSAVWFLAVHLPIPLIVIVRTLGDIGWHLQTFPLLAGAYLLGQYLGDRLYQRYGGKRQ